jgi:hypothetical protein
VSLAVQLQDTGNVVAYAGTPFIVADLVMYFRHQPRPALEQAAWSLFAIGDVLYGIGALMLAQWGTAALQFALAAFFAWLLWRRRRRDRRRAPGLAGYKARAALAKLARRARDAARPRPVLRPVPGGARCS